MHEGGFNAGTLPPYASYVGSGFSDISRLQLRNNRLTLFSKIGVDIWRKLAYIEYIETHTTEIEMLEALAFVLDLDVRVLALLLAAPVTAVFATLTYKGI